MASFSQGGCELKYKQMVTTESTLKLLIKLYFDRDAINVQITGYLMDSLSIQYTYMGTDEFDEPIRKHDTTSCTIGQLHEAMLTLQK